jgi:hypothetical protein
MNTTLVQLDLSFNKIGPNASQSFTSILDQNKVLAFVNLTGNPDQQKGDTEQMRRALSRNQSNAQAPGSVANGRRMLSKIKSYVAEAPTESARYKAEWRKSKWLEAEKLRNTDFWTSSTFIDDCVIWIDEINRMLL